MSLIEKEPIMRFIQDGLNNKHYGHVGVEIITEVEYSPVIDAVPVVHARWDEEDGTCSACHHEAFYDEWTEPKWDYDWDENLVQTGEETRIQFVFSPYCPNCGARMDGDAE